MTVARRTLRALSWTFLANALSLGINFARSVLLARWLPIEIFGIFAFARAFVEVSAILPNWGMEAAFLHRAPENRDEQKSAAVHFTLKLIFTALWTLALCIAALLWGDSESRTAIWVLIATTAITHLMQTPGLLLTRRIVHRRLALVQLTIAFAASFVALGLGWSSRTQASADLALAALISIPIVTVLSNFILLYVWRPVWRPRLAWDGALVRYFVRFGTLAFIAAGLLRLLDRIDDLWVNALLGKTPIGLYSRAYTFATYPRQIVARPINAVTQGSYAALKDDRKRLSQLFFRTNAFLVRSGFLIAGIFTLIAPEFIEYILGPKWLPMLTTFRLMLLFTLLDPIKATAGHLLTAVDHVARTVRVRLLQLAILLPALALFTLLLPWGIDGVALAVNIMLLAGIVLYFRQLDDIVDVSAARIFRTPTWGLAAGLLGTFGMATLLWVPTTWWWAALFKASLFTALYVAALLAFERQQTLSMLKAALALRGSAR